MKRLVCYCETCKYEIYTLEIPETYTFIDSEGIFFRLRDIHLSQGHRLNLKMDVSEPVAAPTDVAQTELDPMEPSRECDCKPCICGAKKVANNGI